MDPYAVLNDPLIETTPSFLGKLYGPYLTFNALEAAFWVFLSLIVVFRMIRRGWSGWEFAYAASFLLFGISDVIELHGTTLMLLLFKLACLVAILGLRGQSLAKHGTKLL